MTVKGHYMPVWYDDEAPPEDGTAMTWNATDKRWEPRHSEDGGEDSIIDGGTP